MAAQKVNKGRTKKPPEPEKPQDLMRWLLTYSDMITLLMLLFVILYAMSKVEQTKYSQIADSLSKVFNLSGIQIQEGSGGHSLAPSDSLLVSPPGTGLAPKVSPKKDPFLEKALSTLRTEIKTGKIVVSTEARGIVVAMAADLYFKPGSAEPNEGAIDILSKVAEIVRDIPNPIIAEGHSDDAPIGGADIYNSNLMLSAARAVKIAETLELLDISKDRLSATGYGDSKPAQPNDSPEGRAANRRVNILIRFDASK